MSFEKDPKHTAMTMNTAEAVELLLLDKLSDFARQMNILEPENPAFVWLQNGNRAIRTDEEALNSGIEHHYPLFPQRSTVRDSPYYCPTLGAKTIGYYKKDNSYEWNGSFNLTDIDLDLKETEQTDPVKEEPMLWEKADYHHGRKAVAEEERRRLTTHLFRPSKDTAEITDRQRAFTKLTTSPELDELIGLKNGSYEALVGLRHLFAFDDFEGSLYDHLCAGDERSPVVGDFRGKIGEYDVLTSVDESVALINHGFDTAAALVERMKSAQLETKAYKLPTVEAIQQFRNMIGQIIALDGSRRVTKLQSDEIWGVQPDDVIHELRKTVENMFYAIGTPLETARMIRDERWSPSTFNLSEPTSYEGGWNITRDKRQYTPIDSPNGETPLVILSGPTTSGKSMTMETDMLIRLAAQATGFVPAKRANIHPCDAFIKLERAGSFERDDLSAFMGEIVMWNNAFKVLGQVNSACVYADESYSTTSPEEQAELQLETAKYLMQQYGARVIMATHNGMVLDRAAALDSSTVDICHPDAYVDENGVFRRNFKLLPGPGDSMSFAVARAHTFPNETLATAEAYFNGTISDIPEVIGTSVNPITDYTPEQRAALMQALGDLSSLFSDGSDALFQVYSTQTNKFSFKLDSPLDDKLLIDEGIEQSMNNLLALQRDSSKSDIARLIMNVPANSPADVLERQRLFGSLIAGKTYDSLARFIPKLISLDFAVRELAAAVGSQFQSINPLAGYEMFNPDLIKNIPSKGVDTEEFLAAFAAADAYLQLHETCFSGIDHSLLRRKLSEYEMKVLMEAGQENSTHTDDIETPGGETPAWERSFIEGWSDEQASLNELLRALGITEMKAISPEALLAILHDKDAQTGRKNIHRFLELSESTIADLQSVLETVGDISFKGADDQQATFELINSSATDAMLRPIAYFRKYRNNTTTVAGQLITYRATKDSLSTVLSDLRGTDSIHLRQFANSLEQHYKELSESLNNGKITQTSVEILQSKKEKNPKTIFENLQTSFEQPWTVQQLSKLYTLCYVAGGLATQDYTPVAFNATGEVSLEDAFNPGTMHKQGIVRNPLHLEGSRVMALVSPNGSGKTSYLNVVSAAIVQAHAVGYAPAAAATMPIFKHVIYIDRVTKHDENLSSFAQDIENWKKVYETLDNAEGPVFVGSDEPFTTTSERYQEALTYAVITDFFKKGDRYMASSTHNHAVVNRLGSLITP